MAWSSGDAYLVVSNGNISRSHERRVLRLCQTKGWVSLKLVLATFQAFVKGEARLLAINLLQEIVIGPLRSSTYANAVSYRPRD